MMRKLHVESVSYWNNASCEAGVLKTIMKNEIRMHTTDASQRRDLTSSRKAICNKLQECAQRRDLSMGRQMYDTLVVKGLDSDAFVMDHLIRMFTSCMNLEEADEAFCRVLDPTIFTWNAIISAHVKLGDCETVLHLFSEMQEKVVPDKITYLCVIKCCGSIGCIRNCRLLHKGIVQAEIKIDVVVGSSLVDMYCRCGDVRDAKKIFNSLSDRNEVSWNVMIAGYAERDDCTLAFDLFYEMQGKGIEPSKVSLLYVLKACGNDRNSWQGRLVHDHVITSGFNSDMAVGSAVMDMYAKCGNIEEARKVFDRLPVQDLVAYCAMISGYAQCGYGHLALELFSDMIRLEMKPDKVTFSSILKACGCIGAIPEGQLVHDMIIKGGFELDIIVGSSMIDMYSKLGILSEAHKVFHNLPQKNIFTWGAIIAGCVQHGNTEAAINLLHEMQQEGLKPSKPMLLCILQSCSSMEDIKHGEEVHAYIAKYEVNLDMVIGSALVNMYSKFGKLEEANHVFERLPCRDSASWSAMILGYAQHGCGHSVFVLFNRMVREGVEPNAVTFSSVLKMCGTSKFRKWIKLVHSHVIESEYERDTIVGSTLVDSYVKCEDLEDAYDVFEYLPSRDVVSWGAMISGYAQHGLDICAFELFTRMQHEGMEPNGITVLYILKSCGATGSIRKGQLIHHQFMSTGLPLDVEVGTALVEMYAKCGCLKEARNIFNCMQDRNTISWSTLISGYAWYGNLYEVECCLDEMQNLGLRPLDSIFTSVLAACSHSGLLDEGCQRFKAMREIYDMKPKAEHINCLVDSFGREGHLSEAEDLLQTMPTPPDPIIHTSLLNAGRLYGNVRQLV